MNHRKGRLVYSTELGRTCPDCERSSDACICAQSQQILGDGHVKVRFDKKMRKGKGVTLIEGVPLTEADLKLLAKKLKKQVGVGGSVKGGCIEIQGEKVEEIKAILNKSYPWKV